MYVEQTKRIIVQWIHLGSLNTGLDPSPTDHAIHAPSRSQWTRNVVSRMTFRLRCWEFRICDLRYILHTVTAPSHRYSAR